MSQDFKFNLFEEHEPNKGDTYNKNNYDTAGHVRNLCFKWLDGRCKFYNYAYLINGEFLPDENTISLTYTTDTVSIEGSNLLPLFESLMEHKPKLITCSDSRYSSLAKEHEPIVLNITIQQK